MSNTPNDAQLGFAPNPIAGAPTANESIPGSSGTRPASQDPVALSSIRAATATNTIDSLTLAQTWNWSTLTTQTGLTLGADAVTSGSILALTSAGVGVVGSLAAFTASGNNAGNTGTVISATISGALSGLTGVKVANAGTGPGLDIEGRLVTRPGTDFTTTGAVNNAPFPNASIVRYTGAGAMTLTGIVARTTGTRLILENASASKVSVTNSDAGSAAANQILTSSGATLALPPNTAVELVYDGTATKWRVVNVSPGVWAIGQLVIAIGTRTSPVAALGAGFVGAVATATIQQAAPDATLLYLNVVTIDGAGDLTITGGPANATAAVTVTYMARSV